MQFVLWRLINSNHQALKVLSFSHFSYNASELQTLFLTSELVVLKGPSMFLWWSCQISAKGPLPVPLSFPGQVDCKRYLPPNYRQWYINSGLKGHFRSPLHQDRHSETVSDSVKTIDLLKKFLTQKMVFLNAWKIHQDLRKSISMVYDKPKTDF